MSSTPPPSPPQPLREQLPRHSERRTRPRLTEQIQIIRELWLLREQARVQAAERHFLTELERLLSGGPYSTSSPPPPSSNFSDSSSITTSTTTMMTTTTTTTSSSSPLATPQPPPPPPNGFHLATSPLFVNDGSVFESNPPPRGDHAPVREIPGAVTQEMEQARASQRVTNLSAEFRARLEGNEDDALSDQRVNGSTAGGGEEMMYPGVVSSVLDSQFRHRLEGVLHRRGAAGAAHAYRGGGGVIGGGGTERIAVDRMDVSSERVDSVVAALRDEVQTLKNVVNASFDIQLDIQRSIRQEVAAAMNSPATLSLLQLQQQQKQQQKEVTASSSSSSSTATDVNMVSMSSPPSAVIKAGLCVVCLENSVDALLYACGHMCTCAACGRQLLAGGLSCPICRAPVRDVVRAYIVTE